MKYPKFLNKNDLVGITALSAGGMDKIKEVKISLNHWKENYRIIVTPDVYTSGYVSTNIDKRIAELNELLKEDIKLLLNICGGDFLHEVLERINYNEIVKKNIWVMGYSDISTLLYILTTKYDLATIYGANGKSFDTEILEEYQVNNLEILKGNLISQKSFMDRKNISLYNDFTDKGILIGGCLDVLRYLFGTGLDKTKNFLKKYKKYGIVWYFDIFTMNSVDFYLTLLQMKRLGYFDYSKTILIGSVMFPKEECDLSYIDALKKLFPDINIIYDANIGHVKPVFTLINGALATVSYKENKMSLDMEFINENNG